MGLRDLALARLAKLNRCPNGTVPKACPNGTVPRGCPIGTADKWLGTLGTVGTAGTLGTAGTTSKINRPAFDATPHPVRLGSADAAPRAWAESLARLDPACPPLDVPLRRWTRFVEDAHQFIDQGWLTRPLGWAGARWICLGATAVR